MRTNDELKAKLNSLYDDLNKLNAQWARMYYESKEMIIWSDDKKSIFKEMSEVMANKNIIRGQIEALTYMLDSNYEMSELDDSLLMITYDNLFKI